MACDIRNATDMVAAASPRSLKAGAGSSQSSGSSRGTVRRASRSSRSKATQRQARIGELLASFAQDISKLDVHSNEDPEVVAAELALLEDDPPASNGDPLSAVPTASLATTLPSERRHTMSSPREAKTASSIQSVPEALPQRSPAIRLPEAVVDRKPRIEVDTMAARLTGEDPISGSRSPNMRIPRAAGMASKGSTRSCAIAMMEGDEDSEAILTSGVIQALVHDYSVMKQNLCDYESAFKIAVAEVARLQAEVEKMQSARREAANFQEILASEVEAQRELHQENGRLAASNEVLRLIMQDSLEADGDIQMNAFIDALLSERTMLLKLLNLSKSVSKTVKAAGLQAASPDLRAVQWHRSTSGTRSRTSSSSHSSLTSPTKSASPTKLASPKESSVFPDESSPLQPSGEDEEQSAVVQDVAAEMSAIPPTSHALDASTAPGGRLAEALPTEALSARALAILQNSGSIGASASQSRVDRITSSTLDTERKFDEDEMLSLVEASSLVESAIFLGSPAKDSKDPGAGEK